MPTPDEKSWWIVRRAAMKAYDVRRPGPENDPLLYCGCGHHESAHHGRDGRGRCGEAGCECFGWHPARVECPDCGYEWPVEVTRCPLCGLTVEAIAERLAGR